MRLAFGVWRLALCARARIRRRGVMEYWSDGYIVIAPRDRRVGAESFSPFGIGSDGTWEH